LLFACSGAADVGLLADQTARALTKQGLGKMYCLAGVGGKIPSMIERVRSSGRRVAIDGCPSDCAPVSRSSTISACMSTDLRRGKLPSRRIP